MSCKREQRPYCPSDKRINDIWSDKCLYFLIKPLKRLYNYAGQLGNTTRKVQDEDLKLAYSVCSVWIYLVYPEFYKDDGKDLGM